MTKGDIMTDFVEIKARYPDSQINALGKQDMDNIRWLIAECEKQGRDAFEKGILLEAHRNTKERLQAENERILDKARLLSNEAMNLDADVAKLQAREEILLSGIAKALVHDDFWTHLTNALATLKAPVTPESSESVQHTDPDKSFS
jgi:hypothetical protein